MFDICLVVTPGQHWEQQWSYLLSHFAPRNTYYIGELDARVRPFQNARQVSSAMEIPGELVLMQPKSGHVVQGETSLVEFKHPEECCYMFGADNAHLNVEHLGGRTPDHLVYIPTDTNDTCYSFVAGAITLWDRAHG